MSSWPFSSVPFTWKRLIGKFYYCGILIVRRQIKNPRTSCEQKFNFLSRDVIGFFSFAFRRLYHNYKIEALSNIEVFI